MLGPDGVPAEGSSAPWRALLLVVVPLVIGAAIYLLWRERNLLMFAWVDAAGLGPGLDAARSATASFGARLPAWVRYSLPNGLWIFALNAALLRIWRGGHPLFRGLWLALALALGTGAELLQAAGLLPGTFDLTDLTVGVTAAVLPIAYVSLERRNRPCSTAPSSSALYSPDRCSRPVS